MLRVAVLDDYQGIASTLADWRSLGDDVAVDFLRRNLSAEEAAAALAPYDVLCLMRERMALPASLIAALPRLKLIIVTGRRTRSIDAEAAKARGILVCNTRSGEDKPPTAELAWGLILALARNIAREHAGMRAGGWQTTVGVGLAGKTLGVLGLGRLGTRVTAIGQAIGMETIAWSQNLTPERAAEAGTVRVAKEELFARADVISVHLVLSPRTRHVVGAAELALMKPEAYLVNTARGGLIDTAALVAALKDNRIAGAGLDVFEEEPLPADHPLRGLPNVVLTPHLGYVTRGNYRVFYRDTVENIAAWRSGEPVRILSDFGGAGAYA